MKIFRFAVLAVLLALFGVAALAQGGEERILHFQSNIRVNEDASLSVTEVITVNCTGAQIKRGIYRDFPTNYRGRYGEKYKVGYTVSGVYMDGSPVNYAVQQLTNGVRIRIGDEDVFVRPGEHTYSISYRTDRQLGFFEKHDELYWNVTGNGWAFSIDKVEAVVTLPGGIRAGDIRQEAYTGPMGAKDRDFTAGVDGSGRALFTTTRKLSPNHGLTIVVGWPKGFVREPTPAERREEFLQDNKDVLTGALGVLLVLGYYLLVWISVGRDPSKKTIVPTWEPPGGLSPAQMRCLARQGCDRKAVTAAITSAAVKGSLQIKQQEDDIYRLKRLGNDESLLSEDEQVLLSGLFGDDRTLMLKQTNHKRIGAAIDAFEAAVKKGLEGRYYHTNRPYSVVGIVASVIALLLSVLSGGTDKSVILIFLTVWLSLWSIGIYMMLRSIINSFKGVANEKGFGKFTQGAGAGCSGLFAVPFVAAEVFVLYLFATTAGLGLAVVALLLAGINLLFHHLLKCYTTVGMDLYSSVLGFRMYLSVAERDSLHNLGEPGKTPELYEKFLPYAIALGVEREWAGKFTDVLERAAVEGRPYAPAWYSGAVWTSAGLTGFGSSLSGSFDGAIASASTPPGSSSGFSGGGSGGSSGGSSGGGGGGGGGGGW